MTDDTVDDALLVRAQAIAERTRAEAAEARADRLATALPDALQARVAEWHDRNFGDAPQLARALIICEEVGELAHVVLKQTQNIRPETATDAHLRDAMGDIVIALCALAASRGWSLWDCVTETAEVVLARDWNADRAARTALRCPKCGTSHVVPQRLATDDEIPEAGEDA